MNKIINNIKHDLVSDKGITVYASILCVIIGLIIGLICLLFVQPSYAFQGFIEILTGAFVFNSSIGAAISNVGPLILVGLSVTFAYKCGLFNIGVAGQFVMGILGCLTPALLWEWHWLFCLICGGLLGALWGVIPGFLKVKFNVNEVISAIMTNWIGLFLVNDIIIKSSMYDITRTETHPVTGTSKIPDWFGFSKIFESQSLTIAIIIAIVIAVVVNVFLNKTKFGYELRACGLNKDSAKYAGINYKKNVIMSMAIAGLLAGIGASLFYLSSVGQYNPNDSTQLPAMGFDGISVSLIGALNPIGGIFSAFLMAFISRGSGTINTSYFPPEMANLIFGIIIYLCAFNSYFKTKIAKIFTKKIKDDVNSNLEILDEENKKEDTVVGGEV